MKSSSIFISATLLMTLTIALLQQPGEAQTTRPAETGQIKGIIKYPTTMPGRQDELALYPGKLQLGPVPRATTLPTTLATTTTDSAGVFSFADLKPGDYTVLLVKRGNLNFPRDGATGTVKAGETLTVEIILQEGSTRRGGRGGG